MDMLEVSSGPAIAAFDIGGTRIKAGIVRVGVVSALRSYEFDAQGSAADILALLAAIGRELLEQQAVSAVGMCIRGIVDASTGVLVDVNGPLSQLIGEPLGELMSELLGYPTLVENDARMYALGELLYGSGQGYQNMVCLTLGTGIGSGVALGGRVLRGTRGVSGILAGHLTVQSDGPRCSCGNIGCLEALIGTPALLELASTALLNDEDSALHGQRLTPRHIFEAAAVGDRLAQGVTHYFASKLAAGVVCMIHAYDPEIVVLGGGIARSAALFLPVVQAYVHEHAWTIPRGRVHVLPAALGDMAALIGIAELASNRDRLL